MKCSETAIWTSFASSLRWDPEDTCAAWARAHVLSAAQCNGSWQLHPRTVQTACGYTGTLASHMRMTQFTQFSDASELSRLIEETTLSSVEKLSAPGEIANCFADLRARNRPSRLLEADSEISARL